MYICTICSYIMLKSYTQYIAIGDSISQSIIGLLNINTNVQNVALVDPVLLIFIFLCALITLRQWFAYTNPIWHGLISITYNVPSLGLPYVHQSTL